MISATDIREHLTALLVHFARDSLAFYVGDCLRFSKPDHPVPDNSEELLAHMENFRIADKRNSRPHDHPPQE
jgi:hypothetical protein